VISSASTPTQRTHAGVADAPVLRLAPVPLHSDGAELGPQPIAPVPHFSSSDRPQPVATQPCPPRVVERNRQNALRSTGPRSVAGKAVARANAIKHGLTANPAAGVIEDPAAFEGLLDELVAHYQPTNPVEAALVERIAVCLWRLRRATLAETAMVNVQCLAEARAASHGEVQRWIERINQAWIPQPVEVPLPWASDGPGRAATGQRTAWQRTRLAELDELREGEMATSGAALEAMATMLENLAERLERTPGAFGCEDAEKMAWLLGDFAGYFPVELHGRFQDRGMPASPPGGAGDASPSLSPAAADPRHRMPLTPTGRMIAEAMDRPPEAPLNAALIARISARLETLRHQGAACPQPLTSTQVRHRVAGAALMDAAAMERLLRYEGHAERSLARALAELERQGCRRT
jgi:hypothetical protein